MIITSYGVHQRLEPGGIRNREFLMRHHVGTKITGMTLLPPLYGRPDPQIRPLFDFSEGDPSLLAPIFTLEWLRLNCCVLIRMSMRLSHCRILEISLSHSGKLM